MDQIGGDVPGEYISEQSLIEKACVEASERDYSGGTNERVPEKRPQEEVKRRGQRRGLRRGHRGQEKRLEKRSRKRYRQMMAEGRIQRSHFKCFYCDQEGQEELSKEQSTRSVFRGSNNSNDGCG